jgi:hypothetical protein
MAGNGAALGSLEPLPGGQYTGTMSSADIYPTHVGIGGIRTQDRALPAYGEATSARVDRAMSVGELHKGLLGTPAGWFVILIVAVVAYAWSTS